VRVTRLYLQNYRVYQEPVEIELPPGLVGVYGLNGSGKSTLLESIRWSLFGRARTSLDLVRTAGVKAECVAEVEFEHEGHLYVVRRSITGANATVKAEAHADGQQVAEGARDTARYVHSVLGMDDVAFRASVFAEQKQLAALSQRQPEERRKLVLQLLGITPVDGARERARTQARDAAQQVERLRSMLPDLDAVRATAQERRDAAHTEAEAVTHHEEAAARLAAELAAAEARHEAVDGRRQEHEVVAAEAASVRSELERASARAERLQAELAELDRAAAQLAVLLPEAEGCDAAERRFRSAQAVVAAADAVAAAVLPEQPEPLDEEAAEALRAAADAARTRLAEVDGLVRAATVERRRATEALGRSQALSGEADCPLCGQALGDAFEQVQAHRAAEVAEVDARLTALAAERAELASATARAAADAKAAAERVAVLRSAWTTFERAQARRAEAERALAAARAQAPGDEHADPAALSRLAAELRRRRKAADEVERLRGRLERRPRLEADLEVERLAVGTSAGRLATLTEKLAAIAFVPVELHAARASRDQLRHQAATAQREAQQARLGAAQAEAAAEAAAQRLADAEGQHAKLAHQLDEARHLLRLSDLLSAFRNGLVARVGPRLSALAGDLFGELTDHEYDDLHVDPDTYEIRVFDQGQHYGMDRFSGSETDLANLALRVAISEHVQFQSGGTVGLLVLDEVFGPLDDDRKSLMLQALERLKARFRQVLVVTHDATIKDQLPNAIEVVKLPGRRATVRTVTGPGGGLTG
jgi:exonuclease SbcC